jgi:hypothetical protein
MKQQLHYKGNLSKVHWWTVISYYESNKEKYGYSPLAYLEHPDSGPFVSKSKRAAFFRWSKKFRHDHPASTNNTAVQQALLMNTNTNSTVSPESDAKLDETLIPTLTSRPRFRTLDLTKNDVAGIRAAFFNPDGTLRRSVVRDDVASFTRITFSRCKGNKNVDFRWQLMLRKSDGSPNATRASVVNILSKCLVPSMEEIDTIQVLIAGTKDQQIHHDTPLRKNQSESDYKKTMMAPNAPSSILIGLGEDPKIHLGIQNDQVHLQDNGVSGVVTGGDGTALNIIRYSDTMAVIETRPACMFRGDLQHAGVNNVEENSTVKLAKLESLKKGIIAATSGKNNKVYSKVFDLLCNFNGLNEFARLHITTIQLGQGATAPINQVGFLQCN